MAKDHVEIDWETGRSPAAMVAKLEGFEAAFFDRELPRAAEEIALKIERDAKELAPVGDTGNLKAGIEGSSEKVAAHTVKAIIKDDVEYAPYQEMGTAVMDAQPFLRPAIEQNRSWIKERVKEAFENAVAIV